MTALAEAVEPLAELILEDPAWGRALPDLAEIAERAAALAIAETGRDPGEWQVAVLACSDARIAELNARFRGREGATDVLSFPAFERVPERAGPRTPLGDLAIALGPTREHAEAHAIPLKDHVLHLILHGCLHLLGYDHETEADAAVMEGAETRALARLGIPDPYGGGDGLRPRPEE